MNNLKVPVIKFSHRQGIDQQFELAGYTVFVKSQTLPADRALMLEGMGYFVSKETYDAYSSSDKKRCIVVKKLSLDYMLEVESDEEEVANPEAASWFLPFSAVSHKAVLKVANAKLMHHDIEVRIVKFGLELSNKKALYKWKGIYSNTPLDAVKASIKDTVLRAISDAKYLDKKYFGSPTAKPVLKARRPRNARML